MDLIAPIILLSGLAFYVACNLGANDVANSMGTSVGSKALTLKQAIIIAGILEFTGAVLFGDRVSKTLATKVVNFRFPSLCDWDDIGFDFHRILVTNCHPSGTTCLIIPCCGRSDRRI